MNLYLSFDLETAKILPENVPDVLHYRPLGISCAAAVAEDKMPKPFYWHGRNPNGDPSPKMTAKEASALVQDLLDFCSNGYTLLTWGGTDFDFNILGEESGRVKDCAWLAMNHVDMLFHIFCSLGYFISLQKASEGMQLFGKTKGISGAQVPSFWAEGQYDRVLQYCAQDAKLALEMARYCEKERQLTWITQKGAARQLNLPRGWCTVEKACEFPLPDTSWMPDPKSRNDIIRWING